MKQNLLLVGIFTLLASCTQIPDIPSQESPSRSSEMPAQSSVTAGSSSYAFSQPATAKGEMFLYKDAVLGFSLSLPKFIDNTVGLSMGEVGVYPDHANQRVFIAMQQWDPGFEGNSIEATTLEQLQKDLYRPYRWEIIFKTIRNEAELSEFIKERYGSDCRVGEKVATQQAGTFDVKIDGWTSPEEGDCFVNYPTVIRYSPSRQQVASWNQGHDVYFVATGNGDRYVYDDDVTNSFRFE